MHDMGTIDIAGTTYTCPVTIESHHGLTTIRAELNLGVLGGEIVIELPTSVLLREVLGRPS